jgi:hypothetical protein
VAETHTVILRIFYTLVIAELFLGGGGRLLEIGPITVRMILFSIAIGLTLVPKFRRQGGPDMNLAYAIVVLFSITHLVPAVAGLMQGVAVNVVFGEVQPMLYWLIAPFFAHLLNQEEYISITTNVVRGAGLLLAAFYLAVLSGIWSGNLDFDSTYETLNSTGEFMFRGAQGLFVYKGFLYLCIAFIFFISIQSPARYLMILLIGCAIMLTLTRGFILSTSAAAFLLLWATGKRRTLAVLMLACVIIAVAVLGFPSLFEGSILYRKDVNISNEVRYDDMNYMLANLDAVTLITGHGFGSLISDSRLSIENSYLWIWWKAGVAGLLFWLMPLVLCAFAFKQIPADSKNYSLGCAYFFSVILIYIQTAVNPYLTNPIGLSFVIIAVFTLRKLARLVENPEVAQPIAVALSSGSYD